MATEAQEAGSAGGHAVGMPQLDFSTWDNQVFWLLVALVAIYMIVTRVAIPRLGSVLAERRGTISNDLAAAEDLKRQAKEAEGAYDKALADARVEAGRIVAKAKGEIDADLDRAIAKADAEIDARTAESEGRIDEIRAGAAQSVREVALATASEIVAALGGRPDEGAVQQAVDAALGTRAEGGAGA